MTPKDHTFFKFAERQIRMARCVMFPILAATVWSLFIAVSIRGFSTVVHH